MKVNFKKISLALFVFSAILINQLGFVSVVKADEVPSLPFEPTETKITPNKFVPRIGEDITFKIDNFGFENTATGIGSDYNVNVYNFEDEDNLAQQIKNIKVPEVVIEKNKDNAWINYGAYISSRMLTSHSQTGMGIEDVFYKYGEGNEFNVTRENLKSSLEEDGLDWSDVYYFLTYFNLLKKGNDPEYGYANRLYNKESLDYTYSISDNPTTMDYATLQGEASWYTDNSQLDPGAERPSKDYPTNWLYYETSDILIEEINAKEGYKPGDTVKLKVKIKNTSNNISNTRLISGLDFGKKEIVKNPTNTDGTPDISFDIPEELGTDGLIDNISIAPKEEIEFETEITLPNDFTNYLNEAGDKILLTPYLYTSSVYRDDSGQNEALHHEEREYNEGIELKVKGDKRDITLVGGPDTLTPRVAEQLIDFNQDRISGANRYETAVEVSKTYDESETVVVASGIKYTDELTATVLANKLDAPILLTRTNDVPEVVLEELVRLKAKRIILIGGELTITPKIENELISKYGESNISRVGGPSRYDTAVLVGDEVRKITGNGIEAIVVDGQNFPDAIAMTSMAVKMDMPILLTLPERLHGSTEKTLSDWNIEKVTIGGGVGSVSTEVENKIKAKVNTVDRIAGENRYETATLVSKLIYPNPEHAVIASGEIYPDAIVAAPYAAKHGYPLLLSRSNDVPTVVMDYLNGN